jgi:hypothetical protein
MTRDTFDLFQDKPRGRFGDNELRDDNRVTKSDLVDLDLFLQNDNPDKKAIAVSTDRLTPFARWVWLPRSLIEYEHKATARRTVVVRVTLPEQLAKEKGLI